MTDRLTELLTDETTPTDGDWDARDARNAFRELLQPEVQALRDRVRELIAERDMHARDVVLYGGHHGTCAVPDTECSCAFTLAHQQAMARLRATLEGEATG